MKLDTREYESKMQKTVANYQDNLSTIRAGRANPDVLKKIAVDYYGSPTPISSIAEIKVADARTIVITAWDKSIMKGIEKAILTSDLGINPQNDGSCIRLSFPPTTEERRRELSKQISKMGEDAKVAIRNIRRDGVAISLKLVKDAGRYSLWMPRSSRAGTMGSGSICSRIGRASLWYNLRHECENVCTDLCCCVAFRNGLR